LSGVVLALISLFSVSGSRPMSSSPPAAPAESIPAAPSLSR
jgi:hypothetical protein